MVDSILVTFVALLVTQKCDIPITAHISSIEISSIEIISIIIGFSLIVLFIAFYCRKSLWYCCNEDLNIPTLI